LHARDHTYPGEARKVRNGDMLSVLDAKPAIAWAVLLRHPLEDIELSPDGAVADGVHHDVEARLIRTGHPSVQVVGGGDVQARILGASVNGCSMAAVCEPNEPSTNPLSAPIRSHASPRPRAATVSRNRSHVDKGTAA
jgi:hypothetical protein